MHLRPSRITGRRATDASQTSSSGNRRTRARCVPNSSRRHPQNARWTPHPAQAHNCGLRIVTMVSVTHICASSHARRAHRAQRAPTVECQSTGSRPSTAPSARMAPLRSHLALHQSITGTMATQRMGACQMSLRGSPPARAKSAPSMYTTRVQAARRTPRQDRAPSYAQKTATLVLVTSMFAYSHARMAHRVLRAPRASHRLQVNPSRTVLSAPTLTKNSRTKPGCVDPR